MRQWILLSNGWFFHAIQKNASSSIKLHRVDNKNHMITGPTFAVIRNPLDRLVSAWANRGQKIYPRAETFEEFVECVLNDDDLDAHVLDQRAHLEFEPLVWVPFENIAEWCEQEGIPLKHANKSEHDDYEDYYSPELRARVLARFKDDFDTWRQARGWVRAANADQ